MGPSTSDTQGRELARRTFVLFLNFLLIILAYYQVKTASRSILIEFWGADKFPWVWIASALVLGSIISFYHGLVERYSRLRVVLGSLIWIAVAGYSVYLGLSTGGPLWDLVIWNLPSAVLIPALAIGAKIGTVAATMRARSTTAQH